MEIRGLQTPLIAYFEIQKSGGGGGVGGGGGDGGEERKVYCPFEAERCFQFFSHHDCHSNLI